MSSGLEGKIAVVTGAAAGIGLAACEKLAGSGAIVVAVDRAEAVRDEAATLAAKGLDVSAVVADVSDEAGVQAYFTAADARGGLDLLFNNAGVFAKPAPLDEDYPVDEFDRVLRVNVRSVWLGMRGALPRMTARGGGVIVNTSSLGGLRGFAGIGPYVTSKHAIIGLTRHGAAEGGPLGVRVHAVCPGIVDTPMGQQTRDMFGDEGAFQDYVKQVTPLQRTASAAEVADLVAYLMSDDARFLTGSAIPVDGGIAAVG